MKISTLKTFMNEAAKKYGIKDANIKLNKHGMVIEMSSNNHLQFAHQFSEAVKSKLVVEGFAFKEIKDDSDFDKIVKNYLFKNANITTNRDNEQIIIPTDNYGYGYDNGEEYFDTDYQNSIDNMSDDEYQNYVLFHDVNTLPYSDVEFLPDDENSTITFSATCCDVPDECYGDECYSGNLFDRISTDYDTDVDYRMSVDDMIDKDYEENDDYETDLSKVSRSAKRIVDFGTDDTDLDEEEIDEKRKDILLGKMQESFKYMPTDKKRLINEIDFKKIKAKAKDFVFDNYTINEAKSILSELIDCKKGDIRTVWDYKEIQKKYGKYCFGLKYNNNLYIVSAGIGCISPIKVDEKCICVVHYGITYYSFVEIKDGKENRDFYNRLVKNGKTNKYEIYTLKGAENICGYSSKNKNDIDEDDYDTDDDSVNSMFESRKLRRKLMERKGIESQFGKKLRNRKFSK